MPYSFVKIRSFSKVSTFPRQLCESDSLPIYRIKKKKENTFPLFVYTDFIRNDLSKYYDYGKPENVHGHGKKPN